MIEREVFGVENQSASQKYRGLESMDTETLKELIRTDCFGEVLDEACILHVLHILKSREPEQLDQAQKVEEAWRRFQEKYHTPEGEGCSLYDSTPQLEQHQEESARNRGHLRRLPRKMAVVAAVIGVLFATLLAAQAAGLNLWNVVVQWSEETFRFSYQGDGPSSSWMDGQEELEGTQWLEYLPTWIPEGYTVEKVETYEYSEWATAAITFSGEEMPTFYLCLEVYDNLEQMQYTTYEKDDAPIQEQKLSNGGTVYFYTNGGDGQSVFRYENMTCAVAGDMSKEMAVKIYETIERGVKK